MGGRQTARARSLEVPEDYLSDVVSLSLTESSAKFLNRPLNRPLSASWISLAHQANRAYAFKRRSERGALSWAEDYPSTGFRK